MVLGDIGLSGEAGDESRYGRPSDPHEAIELFRHYALVNNVFKELPFVDSVVAHCTCLHINRPNMQGVRHGMSASATTLRRVQNRVKNAEMQNRWPMLFGYVIILYVQKRR